MNILAAHKQKVCEIVRLLKKNRKKNDKKQIRFSHGSTNSTRVQDKSNYNLVDISSLNEVLKVDTKRKIAIVEPNVAMDKLVDACLHVGLLPKVVMEFPGITCGGGVNGAALEASSFRYGQFNDTCIAYECLLGDGSVLNVSKKSHSDLYYGISGSYGSIALITAITISLVPAKGYIQTNFYPVSTKTVVAELQKHAKKNQSDYLDAIIFNETDAVIISGCLTNETRYPVTTFTKEWDEWFYLYAKKILKKKASHTIITPVKDFLFRYDRGAFWMGNYAFELFSLPNNKLMRRVFDPLMHTRIMYKALHRSNVAQQLFIQDFYIPYAKTNNFLKFTKDRLGIFPLWLCPIKPTKTPQYLSPHYRHTEMLIDIGVWGNIPKSMDSEAINKTFETYVQKIGGRKMLYAESFYDKQSFWNIYNQSEYDKLRNKYRATNVFPTVWEKTHVKKHYSITKFNGVMHTIGELVLDTMRKK